MVKGVGVAVEPLLEGVSGQACVGVDSLVIFSYCGSIDDIVSLTVF